MCNIIPQEIYILIAEHLNSYQDIQNLSCVNKTARKIYKDRYFWIKYLRKKGCQNPLEDMRADELIMIVKYSEFDPIKIMKTEYYYLITSLLLWRKPFVKDPDHTEFSINMFLYEMRIYEIHNKSINVPFWEYSRIENPTKDDPQDLKDFVLLIFANRDYPELREYLPSSEYLLEIGANPFRVNSHESYGFNYVSNNIWTNGGQFDKPITSQDFLNYLKIYKPPRKYLKPVFKIISQLARSGSVDRVIDICKTIVDYIPDFDIEVEMCKLIFCHRYQKKSIHLEFVNECDTLMRIYLIAGEKFTLHGFLYRIFMYVCSDYQRYNQSFTIID